MVLAMSRPFKRPKTGTYYFRKAVPLDLQPLVGKKEEKRALGTKDPAEARRLHAEMAARVHREWHVLRSEAVPLTQKQIVALSGILYRDLRDLVGEEPGSSELWGNVLRLHDEALENGRTEQWFGSAVDDLLLREGLKTDPESRQRLIGEAHKALSQAADVLQRHASGDWREDAHFDRFPSFQKSAQGFGLSALFDKWRAESKPSPSTVSTWSGVVRNLAEHLGDTASDIRRITPQDIVRWKDAAVERGLAPKTINDSNLGCANALFRYAVDNHLLTANPAQGVKVKTKAKAGSSKLPYTDTEVAHLLDLAAKETHPARRWLPLLAACTGARIGELAQLWGCRVWVENGVHVMRIAPAEDMGSIKNEGSERTIPVHPALVDAGFLDFVKSSGEGPLFYRRSSGSSEKKHASKGLTNRQSSWIRAQGFVDGRKSPNHAVRHWFKTAAARVGIPDSTANAIQGHTTPGEASKYRHFDVKTLAEAIAKIPIPGHQLDRTTERAHSAA